MLLYLYYIAQIKNIYNVHFFLVYGYIYVEVRKAERQSTAKTDSHQVLFENTSTASLQRSKTPHTSN